MTRILELREKIRNFYGKFEIYIVAGIKFILAITAFMLINTQLGYFEKLSGAAPALILALLCTFLPVNTIVVISCGLILVHLSALSIEVCVIALCLFLLMFFMYYKFSSQNGYSTVLTPILCFFQVPQVMPVTVGLLKGPASYLSILCGTVVFYYVQGVQKNIVNFSTTDETEITAKVTAALKMLLGNKEMYLVLSTFLITAVVVYFIRHSSIEHAWRIAIITGNALQLIIFLVGYILLGFTEKLPWVAAGILLSGIISFILEFFLYNLDYSRVERVQFEDDEYYYFVKAVPKVYVAKKDKKVKQITPKKKQTINRKELAEELDIDQELLD